MSTSLRHVGRYELHERLGRSNFSEVWKAYDPQRRCYVALKLLTADTRGEPDYSKNFSHEVGIIAALHHPNIVQIHDSQLLPTENSTTVLAYLATDYIEGETLASYIRKIPHSGMKLPWADIVRLFASMSIAIDHAHQNGVIHGNLKPTDVILGRSPIAMDRSIEPMITDFGLARILGITTGLLHRRSIEAISYISPEQAKGHPGNAQSDIYALGVMLYEISTGVLPFQGNRPVALLMQHTSATPPSPDLINPNITPAVTKVILRSLAKNPEARFQTASSMTIALAKALNLPIPERLNHLTHQSHNGLQTESSAKTTMIDSSVPVISISSKEDAPASSSLAKMGQNGAREADARTKSPLPDASLLSSRRRAGRYKQQVVFAVLSVLLLLTIIVAGFGAYSLLQKPTDASQGIVGHAFFVSSGQLNENSSTQGINDELQIDLSGIPKPATGKSYYAWLLPDKIKEGLPIYVGKLSVDNGKIHFLYTGGQNHINLLEVASRFLITEEDSTKTLTNPSPDINVWRYYAEITQSPSAGDQLHFSMLDHFRHLLVESPELKVRNLRGGLVIWLLQNTQKVFALSRNAKDAWQAKDYATTRRQIVEMVDYLDGNALARTELPPSAPPLIDQHNAQIALLGQDPRNPDPAGYTYEDSVSPGYIYLINLHLSGMLLSTDTTQDQRTLTAQINTALKTVDSSLSQVRQDALKLLRLDHVHLAQASSLSLLDEMISLSQIAYTGHLNQTTGQAQGGMVWIYGNVQRLADFVVRPYSTSQDTTA